MKKQAHAPGNTVEIVHPDGNSEQICELVDVTIIQSSEFPEPNQTAANAEYGNLFVRAVDAIHGDATANEIGAALDVGDRNIRRWYGDDSLVPEGVWRELESEVRQQSESLRSIAAAIRLRINGSQD